MDINFELYKIFYHTAQSENFSEAGRKLFITQSAVSQGIKNLENKLGVRLFLRKSRSSKLTPEGELLFTHISQAYNFIKTAEQKIAELHHLGSGEIRIGASDTVCKYFLLPYLRQFSLAYPKIKIQVINRTSVQILEILQKGAIDFGIITLPANGSKIQTTELTKVQDIWVASPKFEKLKKGRLSLSELTQEPLLLLEKTSATRRNLDQYFGEHNLSVVPEIELESVDLLLEFAKIGLGVAHVVRESAEPFIESGDLFEIQTKEALPLRSLGIVTTTNVPLSRAAEEFIAGLGGGYN